MSNRKRLFILITGAVQGVGFRPFVFRLADELNLLGWVINSSRGVEIEVEADEHVLNNFLLRLKTEIPLRAYIQSIDFWWLELKGYASFEIRKSEGGEKSVFILPDIATCPDCTKDIFDPNNRRYHYPFTNCTNCGPRYSIIEELPYDRIKTSMKQFQMCPDCQEEYNDPHNRRFHAQPNACPECGPQIWLSDNSEKIIATRNHALTETVKILKSGKTIAVKGIGGFHLMAAANNHDAVNLLRLRKHRPSKPFAIMVPSIEWIYKIAEPTEVEMTALKSPEGPIVLVRKKENISDLISESVSPENPYLGIMLPSTPLHHLILSELNQPVIATSGNLSDEPICIDNKEALERLNSIADYFLLHNRLIDRPVDDSIVRVINGRSIVMRRARGLAPLPVPLVNDKNQNILALGGHLKNTISLQVKNNCFISQHLGDLDSEISVDTYRICISDLKKLYNSAPEIILHDLHPNYQSTVESDRLHGEKIPVQHHVAHLMSVVAENRLSPPLLGFCWDGTGYGTDETIWGSEVFLWKEKTVQRFASLYPFPLAGGDAGSKEPVRSALGLLKELNWFDSGLDLLKKNYPEYQMEKIIKIIAKDIGVFRCHSMGRLFDGFSALLGIAPLSQFEGEAAMRVEFAADKNPDYNSENDFFPIIENRNRKPYEPLYWMDWRPFVRDSIDQLISGKNANDLAMKFHSVLVNTIFKISEMQIINRLAVSGGCFQNKVLLSTLLNEAEKKSVSVFTNQRVPPNDGGISLGQVAYYLSGVELVG